MAASKKNEGNEQTGETGEQTSTPASTPAAAANAVKRANATTGIDFGAARDADTFTDVRVSPWVKKVHALVDGVKAGNGEYGKFYRIGTFTAASGARTTIRNLAKQADNLPANPVTFEVEKTGNGGSELWASVGRLAE